MSAGRISRRTEPSRRKLRMKILRNCGADIVILRIPKSKVASGEVGFVGC